jgi:hypothetical protein
MFCTREAAVASLMPYLTHVGSLPGRPPDAPDRRMSSTVNPRDDEPKLRCLSTRHRSATCITVVAAWPTGDRGNYFVGQLGDDPGTARVG